MSSDEKRQAQQLIDNAVEKQPEQKKKGCRRGCLPLLVIGLLLSIPLWWIGCHTTPLRVSHETTRALGPMMSDGKRLDYFRALEEKNYPPQMQTDENGYRILIRGVGGPLHRERWNPQTNKNENCPENVQEALRRQVYEKLGLDPDVPPTLDFSMETLSTFELCKKEVEKQNKENPETKIDFNELDRKILSTPWTLEEYPFMEDWLKQNDPVLDLLGEAIRKPAFCIPWVRENENMPMIQFLFVNEIQFLREFARATSARVRYRLGTGDIDGAIYDTITIHRLGRHTARQGMLVSALVGIAIDGIGTAIGIAENPNYPPSKEQLQHLLSELDQLPPFITVNENLESERYFSLGCVQDIYWGNSPPFPGGPLPEKLYPIMSWTVDINIFLARINEIYDALLDGTITEDDYYHVSWNPLAMFTVRGRTTNMANVLGGLFFPAVHAAKEAWRRMECASNMRHLTLALLLYEKDHGHMPQGDWREAVKPYLGANAEKYFQCPTHPSTYDAKDCTTYVMVRIPENTVGVENPSPTPQQILLVEVFQPQKLGQGDGRFPFEKAMFSREHRTPNFDGIGSYHTGGVNCGVRSGAVHFISETIAPEKLDELMLGTATEFPY